MVIFVYFLLLIILPRTLMADNDTDIGREARFKLAQSHYQSVYSRIQCREPQARVIRITTSSSPLLPPATILHRCGKKAGCCDTLQQKCVPKRKERVRLYFFENTKRHGRGKRHGKRAVRKLIFTNHTECHCVDARKIPR